MRLKNKKSLWIICFTMTFTTVSLAMMFTIMYATAADIDNPGISTRTVNIPISATPVSPIEALQLKIHARANSAPGPKKFDQVIVGKWKCGAFHLGDCIDQAVKQATHELIPSAKTAFNDAMKEVTDNQINPLVDKAHSLIDASVNQATNEVSGAVNQAIDHGQYAIKDVIDKAANTAQLLVDHTVDDVEKAIESATAVIIRDATQSILLVEKQFFRDAGVVLKEINALVRHGDCMVTMATKQMKDGIYKLIKELSPWYRFSKCWHKLDYSIFRSLEDLTDMELYNYQKECTLLDKITPETKVNAPNGLLDTYAQGQLYAAEFYCLGEIEGAPAFQDRFAREWIWWGEQYATWSGGYLNPSDGPDGSSTIPVPTVSMAQPVQLKATAPTFESVLTAKTPATSGSAMEKYTQAMAALQKAEKTVRAARDEADDNKVAISVMDVKMKAIEAQLLLAGTKIVALETGVAGLTETVTSVSGVLDTVQMAISKIPTIHF